MVSGEELRETVKIHLALESMPDHQATKLIYFHMGRAAFVVASSIPFRDLIVTTYLPYDENGKFSINRRITPHQAFIDGDENQRNWRRLVPIDFNHFSMEDSGIDAYYSYYHNYASLLGIGNRRYTVLPKTKPDITEMQVLDPVPTQSEKCIDQRKIKLLYIPKIPAIDEFPEEAIPYLLTETLLGIAPHLKLQSGNSYVEQLKMEQKSLRFRFKNMSERVETMYNPQQNNDLTHAFLMGQTSDHFLFGGLF